MRLRSVLPILAALLICPSLALAATIDPSQITGIVTFGDSLSDPGNASIATGGVVPGPGYATRPVTGVPYPVGYYTNPQYNGGPSGLWIDQLAGDLNVSDPTPFLAGGTNYAIASALTGSANPQDMENQIGFFAGSHSTASATALYTFWGGANDILNGQNPITAANNIELEIEQLATLGGKNFLWLNLPGLGDIPALTGNTSAQAAANAASAAFNAQWAVDVIALDGLGINVIGVNVDTLFNDILANPTAYGFTNVTQACLAIAGCDPNTFLYFDSEHPTTAADALIADAAYQDLTGHPAPTPEPSTLMLLGTSLLGLGTVVRTRRP